MIAEQESEVRAHLQTDAHLEVAGRGPAVVVTGRATSVGSHFRGLLTRCHETRWGTTGTRHESKVTKEEAGIDSPASSCLSARAKARPTTWEPAMMTCTRYRPACCINMNVIERRFETRRLTIAGSGFGWSSQEGRRDMRTAKQDMCSQTDDRWCDGRSPHRLSLPPVLRSVLLFHAPLSTHCVSVHTKL